MTAHPPSIAHQIIDGDHASNIASNQIPPLPTKGDRLKYAFDLIAKHGENLADYVLSQFLQASTPEQMIQWEVLSQVVEDVLGYPLAISDKTAMRFDTDGSLVDADNNRSVTGKKLKRLDDC